MGDNLEKLIKVEEKKRRQESEGDKLDKKVANPFKGKNTIAVIDIDSKLDMLKESQTLRKEAPSFLDSLIRGVAWGNTHIWDRSYTSKWDFSVSQRMKIINYVYDRFTARAGKVSREVALLPTTAHKERLASKDISVTDG